MRPSDRSWTEPERIVLMLDAAHGRPERHTAHALQRSVRAVGWKRESMFVTRMSHDQRRALLERLT